jgi:S1-C subfamily serine protease
VAIGSPFGLNETVTAGIVSATDRNLNGREVIQTDAPINPGNSGGVLADRRGRVIGINDAIQTGSDSNGNVGIGFAVPIDTAKRIVPQLKTEGRVDRGFLGVEDVVTVDASLAPLNLPVDHGVLVQSITPGSPAARAGIRGGDLGAQLGDQAIRLGGDIITEVDGRAIRTNDDLVAAISGHKKGDTVKIRLLRDGRERTVEVELASRPTQTDGHG